MKMYGATDIGLVRATNQDNFYIDTPGKWTVLADGMGGHKGGETASSIAVDVIKKSMTENTGLKEAIDNANKSVFDFAAENEEFSGMGTTIVLCKVMGKTATIAHVGDSRAYKFGNGELTRITKDHSIVQQLIDSGTITEEQAKYHPQRNLITRAVGTEKSIEVDIDVVDFIKGDCILICSDGLSSYVNEEEILNILKTNTGSKAVDELINAANKTGGKDNITVVLVKA